MERYVWRRVEALYRKRIISYKYLVDVRPWELSSNEFERLIVDSRYVDIGLLHNISISNADKLQKRYLTLPRCLKKQIQKHYA